MIEEILTDAGVAFRRTRFTRLPEKTYAVYSDDVETEGADGVPSADGLPGVRAHNVTVELYSTAPDGKAEAAVEEQLDLRGIPWEKEDRYWLSDINRYQVVYDFTYYDKRRIG